MVIMSKAGMSESRGWTRLATTVARSVSRLLELCTGWPSSVRLVRALRWAGATGLARSAWASLVVVGEQHRGEGASHVPVDVIGQHADEQMGPDPFGFAVTDGSDVEVHVVVAERRLSAAEPLVGGHHLGWGEVGSLDAGADDVKAVERCLFG